MMTLRTLAGKLLLFPIAIENMIVLTAALAGSTAWFTGERVGMRLSWAVEPFLTSFLTFVHRVTLSFFIFGGLALVLRYMRSRVLSATFRTKADNQPWLFLVILILASSGALAGVFARSLPLLVQDNIRLLQGWGVWEGIRRGDALSGIYLLPALGILLAPGLAVMTAFAFVMGAAATLGYVLLGLEDSLRVLLRSVCLQIAFVLSLFFALAFLDTVKNIVDRSLIGPDAMEWKVLVVPWLAGQAEHLAPVARRFTWLLPGFFICTAIGLMKARAGETGAQEETSQFPGELYSPEPTPIEGGSGLLNTDERFEQSSYMLKLKYLSNPFYKTFEIFGFDNQLIFVAKMNGLSLFTRVIRVTGSWEERSETLRIVGRRFLRFPDLFYLTHCPSNRKEGTFKNSPTGWLILNEAGREIATMKMERAAWGSTQGRLLAGDLCLCRFTSLNILRPVLMIDFSEDTPKGFDRKLALGLALVVSFQSVAFNEPIYPS